MVNKKAWFVYILRCSDKTFYTGITTDLERRLIEHNAEKSITKYTRVRQPVEMVYNENAESRSAAGKREVFIKSLTRIQKVALIDEQYTTSTKNENKNEK